MTGVVSSTSSRVFFDPPVFGQINPPVSMGRSVDLSYQEIQALCKKLRELGWEHRAIVVRRKLYSSGQPATYDMSQWKAWGCVQELRTFSLQHRPYIPLKVQWTDGTETDEWPNDLFLIHAAVAQMDLGRSFEEQLKDD